MVYMEHQKTWNHISEVIDLTCESEDEETPRRSTFDAWLDLMRCVVCERTSCVCVDCTSEAAVCLCCDMEYCPKEKYMASMNTCLFCTQLGHSCSIKSS